MARSAVTVKLLVMLAVLAAGAILLLPPPAFAQEEVASSIRRYKEWEASTGLLRGVRGAAQAPAALR